MNKVSILCVFAHPDDEFAVAGLISKARSLDIPVNMVCITKGEAGKIGNNKVQLLSSKSKAEIRTEEYMSSNKILNTNEFFFLEAMDGDSANWNKNELINKLISIVEDTSTTHIVTFQKNKINKHPDHVAATEIVHELHIKRNDIDVLELTTYTDVFLKRKFWFLPKKLKRKLVNRIAVQDNNISTIYKLTKREMKTKLKLLSVYTSQFPDEKNRYYSQPLFLLKYIGRYEGYHDYSGKALANLSRAGCNFA